MGWWSPTILGGDSALDYHGDMMDIIAETNGMKIDYYADLEFKPTAKMVDKAMPKLVKYARDHNDSYDPGVAAQVLGVIIITSGAKMSEKTRKYIHTAAVNDEWAIVDPERKEYIDSFARQIKRYTGKRKLKVAEEGLFDMIAKKVKG